MRLTPTGRPVPSAGLGSRTNGLPWVKDRVVKPSPGSLDAARTAVTIADVQQRLDALGVVCTPEMSLADAILTASTPNGGGKARVLLTEGTWDFTGTGLTINQDNVEVIALSPGHTFFRAVCVTQSMVTVSGAWCRIQGVTFVDQAGAFPVVTVSGPYSEVIDCKFQYGLGVLVSAADGVLVRNCLSDASSNAGIVVSGASDHTQIINNRFLAGGSITVSSTSPTNTLIVGNSLTSGTISYPTGCGTVESGNSPSGNILRPTFTLADNTTTTDIGPTVSWDVAQVFGVSLDFALYRGATPDITTGRLDLVMNSAECLVYMDAVTTTVDPGVTFMGSVVAGVAYLQYTTTATGAAATLRFTSVKESAY